jgi:hypothetical protein
LSELRLKALRPRRHAVPNSCLLLYRGGGGWIIRWCWFLSFGNRRDERWRRLCGRTRLGLSEWL